MKVVLLHHVVHPPVSLVSHQLVRPAADLFADLLKINLIQLGSVEITDSHLVKLNQRILVLKYNIGGL